MQASGQYERKQEQHARRTHLLCWPAFAVATIAALGSIAGADAQTGFRSEKKGGFGFKGMSGDGATSGVASPGGKEGRLAIRPSGLVPVFNPGVRCPQIASPFASPNRYDGSKRPPDRFGGLHGGLDISLPEGTPLFAAAGGKILHKGEGRQTEGTYLWLQHPPEETGLPFWVYSKYQHFRELPAAGIGALVKAGQPVGISGRSGTVGGHYGAAGYPHLHWTTIASASGDYRLVGSIVSADSPQFIDPLAIYVSGLRAPSEVGALSPERKRVSIAHVTDGDTANTRLVWPVACPAR